MTTKHLITSLICGMLSFTAAQAIDLTQATIVYNPKDAALVGHMAQVLAGDIERLTGIRPPVSTQKGQGENILLATTKCTLLHKELKGTWERYAIEAGSNTMAITGSDARGLAYGVLHVSQRIGVNPWYWWADVPCRPDETLIHDYQENYVSPSPAVKYRGLFINDEDWGMKTWASRNFEKALGDIGPQTYDKVCELILRLRGNMLAPAMHTCTGAFYSHPESQVMADKWGIMITTSHCEPMLVNNAAPSEWDKAVDGEWNWETNRDRIVQKFDNRMKETAAYQNIYTVGMRGLHDEAMKGSEDNAVRARTLESVITTQRSLLEKYKKKKADQVPQIFVPYKETLDIYDAGLNVPDDITLVWPDDNYGYMKRVPNAAERRRKGGNGVYYHLSYLGTPHDYLWLSTTAPMLMYAELRKAYRAGADRYWLLNVGDIKPMEIATQMFFDMAYCFKDFNYDNAPLWQAEWLGGIFGEGHREAFQNILDNYYRLAWQRKPEYMGYEIQWDSPENERLYDSDFSFEKGTAQQRLRDYQRICDRYRSVERQVADSLQPALFEMLGYGVLSAAEMNKKFLYAQANHETGGSIMAQRARKANEEIERLRVKYNTLLDGKWDGMISEIPPGFVSQYQKMPELSDKRNDAYRLPQAQHHLVLTHAIDLTSVLPDSTATAASPFRLLRGIGTDGMALQLGEPLDADGKDTLDIALPPSLLKQRADSLRLCISVIPFWPVSKERSNRFWVKLDGGEPVVCENVFQEWSMEWKLQVLENRKEFLLTFPFDAQRKTHTLTLGIIDPGQMIQHISFETSNIRLSSGY